MKCFNDFVQSPVTSRRQGDENPNSGVVAETTKLLAIGSNCYQIMDCGGHLDTMFMNDETTDTTINHKMFNRLVHINDQPYEVELAKTDMSKEPIIVSFFILQHAKLRWLELFYKFSNSKFSVTGKFEEVETNTDSLYRDYIRKGKNARGGSVG